MSQPPTPIELRAGSTLGRYELLLPIAKGGMAQVWAARLRGTRGFQKVVAVKTVRRDVMDNTRMERMFLEEAQLAAQIHHPNVVGTLELGEHEGTLYLVMEWVDGEPLNQIMTFAAENGGIPLAIGVNLIGQACQGLYAAHELRDDNGALLGLVHRDVSPQNLLVSFSGTAKLVDFGIAKATARSSGLTEAGEVKGKFAFMAPEQVRGQQVDCRTDLFALGILLYAITTGKHPFRGAHPGETLQNICSRTPTPPSALLPDYPVQLEAVVLKALEKAPAQRFASANDLLSALEAAMPGPLEASFDVQVSGYLRELYGARVSERRLAIRAAQEQVDRQRAESSCSSVGTLRAISIDRQDSGSFSVSPSGVMSATPSSGSLDAYPEPKRATRKLAAAVAVVGLAVSGVAFELSRAPAPSASSAAAVPLPSEPVSRPASTQPSSAPAPTAPSVSVAELPSANVADKRESKSGRVPRLAVVASKPQPSASTTSRVPAPSAAPPNVPVAPPVASANAWDPGAFGGRH